MPIAVVTGAAGFIGSSLSEALLDRGYRVRGVDNLTTGRRTNLRSLKNRDGFKFHEVDIRDKSAMNDLVEGAEYVFHQAAVPSVPRSVDDPITTTDANCTGTATIHDAARRADVDTVVVASSSSVYGSSTGLPKVESMTPDPESPYALSKYYTEKLAIQFSDLYDIDTVALRYFNVFGPGQNPNGEYAAVIPKFVQLMLDGDRPTIYGDGEQSRDFTFVDNVIQANIQAAEGSATGVAVNVGCGGQVTINELVGHINDILGTDIEPVHDSPRPGDVRHSHADLKSAREEIEYEPKVDFQEGLERTVSYFKNA